MADKELNKLSPEQIQKLARTLSEAKDLTYQQEDIIKQVLAGEAEIGNARIAALEKYFDVYSKKLDLIARKYSELDDTFLIFGQKLNTEYKKLSSEMSEIADKVTKANRQDVDTSDSKSKKQSKPEDTNTISIGQLSSKASKQAKTLEDLRESYFNHLLALETRSAEDQLKLKLARSKQEEDIWLRSTEYHLKELEKFTTTDLQLQYQVNATNTQLDYTNTEAGQTEIGIIRASVLQAEEELKSRKQVEAEIIEFRKNLEYEARSKNNGQLLLEQAIEIEKLVNLEHTSRLKNLDRITQARFEKERLILETELENKRSSKLAGDDPTLHAARQAAMTKEISDLELKYRLANNNRIDEEARKQIKRQVEEKYNTERKAVGELAKAVVKQSQEDQLKRDNPKLAQAREELKAKRFDTLERQARLENNGLLTKEKELAIREQVDKEFEITEKNLNRIETLRRKTAQKKFQDDEKQKKTESFYKENPLAKAELEKKRIKLLAQYELEARLANANEYNKDQQEAVKKRVNKELELTKEMQDELNERRVKDLKKQIADDFRSQAAGVLLEGPLWDPTDTNGANGSISKRFNNAVEEMTDAGYNEAQAKLYTAVTAISSLASKLESKIDAIALSKGFIDTRLQGSNNEKVLGSYWDQLTKDMISVGAVTPYFKQEKFAENIKSLVDTGIAFDLKQRAFLMTIQEKIANTFDVADSTLLRLVRIQQEDSTAGRLGMESALNSFLNNMYENTEYLKTVASGVRSSLQEMEALMSGAEATEVEYQVQKWMGSLYSVGMSQEAVNSIATALGQIAAGQVEALTGGTGAGNLMVMAANEAGLSISDILAKGLDATSTNKLLQATVNYLADIAESTKDNRVVQQQLASVFGVKASDLKAATNLSTSSTLNDISTEQLTYDNMLRQLYKMAGSMNLRTSAGEMMTNVWDNMQYSMAGSMASSPVAYLTYKLASLLESTTGGIDVGLPLVMGTGLPVQFKVSDLMRAASMAGGVLGSLGSLINGLASSFSGHMMLASMGIDSGSGLKVTPRGTGGSGIEALAGGGAQTTSGSGYVGNASSSDIKNSTIQQNEDEAKKQIIEATEEAGATQIDLINTNVLKIYELLDEVANGKRSLSVKVAGYGLTSLGNNTSLSSAQGGVSGLLSNTAANSTNATGSSLGNMISSGSGTSGHASSATNSGSSNDSSFGISPGLDLGGWTMM